MEILVRLARTGLRRGIQTGSRPWLVAGITAGMLVIVRRVVREPPETVYRTELEPGERLEIRTLLPNP